MTSDETGAASDECFHRSNFMKIASHGQTIIINMVHAAYGNGHLKGGNGGYFP